MIQVIGLIIAVYALVRFIQVPIEMTSGHEQWLGIPFLARVIVVAGLSVLGFLAIAVLALILLTAGNNVPRY